VKLRGWIWSWIDEIKLINERLIKLITIVLLSNGWNW
jgi:hypothetical protein